jgi:hypothetical protein
MPGDRAVGAVRIGLDAGGGSVRVVLPWGAAGRACGMELGRLAGGALGRTEVALEGRGEAGREVPDGRDPWLEGRDIDDPRECEADEPLEGDAELPLDPR